MPSDLHGCLGADTSGYAQLLGWILDHAPGPRIVVSIEGTRSYGIGLARAATTTGLPVFECEQPHRKPRRGTAKSRADPTRSTPNSPYCLSALRLDTINCRSRAPTATAKPCASRSAPATISP